MGARRVGTLEATVDWLLTDSRSLSFPEETLFFARLRNETKEHDTSPIFMNAVCGISFYHKRISMSGVKRREMGEWRREMLTVH